MDSRNLRRRSRNIYPKITIAVLLVVTLILTKAAWNVFLKNNETRENLNETKSELSDLKKREVDLESEISRLNTEKGIDEEIRTKFRVVKEGEEMIMIIDSPEVSSTSRAVEKESLWSKVMKLF